jgi:SAM-dependent methyltransferase
MKIQDWVNRRINCYQTEEIRRLAQDPAYAEQASRAAFYSEVGCWLDCTREPDVLEIGCGPGRYAAMLGCLGFNVVAADLHEFPSWGIVRRLSSVRLESGIDVAGLPYGDESFDAVTCMGALLYFAEPDRALQEMRRVLRPAGRFIVRTVNANNLYRSTHGRNIDPATSNVYTEQELAAKLAENGFSVDSTSAFGFYPPYFPRAWWFLVNGVLSINHQTALSNLCSRAQRVNVNAYARKS